jgi:hypothetical protein
MPAKFNYILTVSFVTTIFLSINYDAKSQGLLDRLKKKVEKAVDKKADDIIDGKKKNSNTPIENSENEKNESSNGRPKLSELKDEDFNKNEPNPEYDDKNTRFQIAKNLMIDIKGKYPNGYLPKWRFINYPSPLKFARENWINPTANLFYEDKNISMGDYGGKAVIRFKPHYNCECYADIIVKENFAVITGTPKVFEIGNFRKILNEMSTGEPCIGGFSNDWKAQGGWGGKVTLSANSNGNILMDFVLEEYSADHQKGKTFMPSQVSYRFRAKGTTVENEMSAEKATAIVVAEQEAKQRQKDYITKTTKQSDSLQKVIAKKYPQQDCRNCFSRNSDSKLQITPTKTAYRDGYGDVYVESSTDWDINTKTEIKNKCGYGLTFIGLQQMYDEEKGYYLVEVTKTMEKGYNYISNQGAMGSLFTSLVGGGSEFNIKVQDKYYPNYATVGAVQWLKVVKK